MSAASCRHKIPDTCNLQISVIWLLALYEAIKYIKVGVVWDILQQSDNRIIQPQNDASAMAAAGQPAFAVCRQHPKLMSMVLEVLINVVMYELGQ